MATDPAQTRTKETLRRARNDAYHALILDAAEKVFARRGYGEAKVQEIAEQAGVATGTVYAIFAGKRELYRAVHRSNLDELARRYAEIQASGSVREQLDARVAVATRFLTGRPDYLRIFLREASTWGHDPGELPPGASEFAAPDLYRRGVENGELRDEDPDLLQSLSMSMSQVSLSHWLRSGCKADADELIRRIQDLYARSIYAPADGSR